MLRIAMVTFVVAGLVALGGRDVRACTAGCACLDLDGGGTENDFVCCGVIDDDTPDTGNAAVDTALDGADEGQACGLVFVGTPGNASSLVQVAGRISAEGVAGCTCLDVDQNGIAEAAATFPPGGDCGRTAAMACLGGHAPPDRDCATIDFNSSNCSSQ